MANTQTTVPTFVSGQILTAQQMMNSAATGVPVFANTTTRDAGFGGSGEKVLAEGQLCYLESTNVVQYYDGAAWATLAPAPAVSSGLTRIGGGTLSGTSVTFSSVFSATYNNYLVTFNSVAVDASTPYLTLKIAATAVHNFMVYETRGSGVGPASANAAEDNAQIYLALLDTSANYITSGHIEICSPFLAARTGVDGTFAAAQNSRMFTTNGVVKNTTSYTAFTIENSSAQTFTGGIVNIYGYALS